MSDINNENMSSGTPGMENRLSRRNLLKGVSGVAAGLALGESPKDDVSASPGYRPREVLIRYSDDDPSNSQENQVGQESASNEATTKLKTIREKLRLFKGKK